MHIRNASVVIILALAGAIGCEPKAAPPTGAPAATPGAIGPATTPEERALGEKLFWDARLSKDGSASCETCHHPDKGWTDGLRFSKKVGGAMNTRNTPTLYNAGEQAAWYWDGRAPTLEKQIEAAWKFQMGADPAAIAKTIGAVAGYKEAFQKVYGGEASAETIVKALASFVRSLRSGGSAYDRFQGGDKSALSADVQAGLALFTGKAGCAQCHVPPLFTDNGFHDVGIGSGAEKPDLGRGAITKDAKDNGKFKTPTLRSVSLTAPYFHDGSAATLEDAVKTIAAGGVANPNLDPLLKDQKLSDAELRSIVEFLKSLEEPAGSGQPALPQ